MAVRELRRAPDLIGRVLDARSVGHWFHRIDTAKEGDEFPMRGQDTTFDLVTDLVEEIELAKLTRARARRPQ